MLKSWLFHPFTNFADDSEDFTTIPKVVSVSHLIFIDIETAE